MQTEKAKIGIALGGGGAKGFAHVGVLEVLRDAGVSCSCVSGTSIGSLVGAAYASGALEELTERAKSISMADIPRLLSPTVSTMGLFSGKNVLELLATHLQIEQIEELPITYAAVAADLERAEPVVFTEGDLLKAIRASISIPLLFTPVVEDDMVLVDGGTVDPVPVEAARNLGADIVIAVDLFAYAPTDESEHEAASTEETKLWPPDISSTLSYLQNVSSKVSQSGWFPFKSEGSRRSNSFISVIENTLAITQRRLTQVRLQQHPPDIVIKPQVQHVGVLDFHRGEAVIELGVAAAKEALPELQSLLN